MSHSRAFDCAWSLLSEYPERLTVQQCIECHVALMAGPDEAGLGVIAIAAMVIGARQ